MNISAAIYLSLPHPAAGAPDPRWINIATVRSMRHPLPPPATSIKAPCSHNLLAGHLVLLQWFPIFISGRRHSPAPSLGIPSRHPLCPPPSDWAWSLTLLSVLRWGWGGVEQAQPTRLGRGTPAQQPDLTSQAALLECREAPGFPQGSASKCSLLFGELWWRQLWLTCTLRFLEDLSCLEEGCSKECYQAGGVGVPGAATRDS